MTLTLYSGPLSLFTAKVRIALVEKGLPYEKVSVGWSLKDRYLPHHPDVARLNPRAQVPILVDGDLTIYDSTLILEYLEDRYPEQPLYPADPAGRARCRQLEAAADEEIFPLVWDAIEETLYPAGPEGRDKARSDAARRALGERYSSLDALLRESEYLCGNYSVADIGTFIMVNAATSLGFPADEDFTGLRSWSARMLSRPAVAEEVEGMTRYLGETLAAS